MDDIGRVDVLEPAQDLVDEVHSMLVCEGLLGLHDPVHVCLKQGAHDVQSVKVLSLRGAGHDIQQVNQVVMVAKVAQELHFSQNALQTEGVYA